MANPYSNYGTAWTRELIAKLEAAGAFRVGIESDKKKRGIAVNVDVMEADETAGLAVIQIREARFRPNRHTRVRKEYLLIGEDADGVFAWPVNVRATNARIAVAQVRRLDSPAWGFVQAVR
jgi:ssDNA-binding replication factor A large subunit